MGWGDGRLVQVRKFDVPSEWLWLAKLICIFFQMERVIFIALQKNRNFIEYFRHVVILFLHLHCLCFLNDALWRYIFVYYSLLSQIALVSVSHLHTQVFWIPGLVGVAYVNAKCTKVAPKPSRIVEPEDKLRLAYASLAHYKMIYGPPSLTTTGQKFEH